MIYAFYSYKGGVGRTFTVAHCAISAAAQRRENPTQRVLAIDLDLEASGLDRFVQPVRSEHMRGFAGLLIESLQHRKNVDWLSRCLHEDLERPPAERLYVASVEGADNLFLMPSGVAPGKGEVDTLNRCTEALREVIGRAPASEAQAPPKAGFFGQFRGALHENFPYVFIDSRTGLSDPAYASTVLIADCIVACVRLNEENIEGVRLVIGNRLARMDDERRLPRHLPLVIVAALVPPRGGNDVEQWISRTAERLVPEIDENDAAVMHRALFPKVVSLPRDANLDLGSHMVLKPNGEPAEGYTGGAPLLTQIGVLTRRLLAENCEHDPRAAQSVELEFYNRKDPERALQYLLKRIEAEPEVLDHWGDLPKGYNDARFRPTILNWFSGVIERWSDEVKSDPLAVHKVALAYHFRAAIFGRTSPDGGLPDGERALELGRGTRIESDTAFLLAQIVEELVKRRHPTARLRDGRELNEQIANEYYTLAIEASRRDHTPAGKAWLHRARSNLRLDRADIGIRDYDEYIAEEVARENGTAAAEALIEQAEALEFVGWYLAGLKTRLAAETVLNREDVPVPGLDLAFAHLGLDKQALEQLQTRRQKVNPDGGLYLREALVRLLCCDIDGSIRAARIARDFSPTMAVPLIHAVACFLKADMSEAGRLLGQISAKDWTEYERGLGALVELYQEGAFSSEESQISTRVESDNWMVALARLAAGGKPSLEFLGVVPHEGLSDQVRTLLIQIMGFGIAEEWRPALGQKIDSLLLSRPYLATRCNWDVDNWVVRKVWNDWIQTQTVHCEARDWIELFWQKIDAAEPPAAEHVTPRKLDERIGADPSSLA